MLGMSERINDSTSNERFPFVDAVVRTGKIMGGIAIGGAIGYATFKGVQEIIPVDADLVSTADAFVTVAHGAFGGFIASEISR